MLYEEIRYLDSKINKLQRQLNQQQNTLLFMYVAGSLLVVIILLLTAITLSK